MVGAVDRPTAAATSAVVGATSVSLSGVTTTGSRDASTPAAASSRDALRLVGRVPPVGHRVAGQEVAHLEGRRRPPVPDHLGLPHLQVSGRQVRLEHRVDHRVELLLRWVPRLEQVVVDVDDVDGGDRGVGVGVRREQRAPRPREQVHRLLEELDAAHLRHPVVGQQHGDPVAAQLQLAQCLERLGTGGRAHHPVVLAVLAPQVAGDGTGHRGVVVDREDDRPAFVGHGWLYVGSSGLRNPRSSVKHHHQSSPGSYDDMSGCPVES